MTFCSRTSCLGNLSSSLFDLKDCELLLERADMARDLLRVAEVRPRGAIYAFATPPLELIK